MEWVDKKCGTPHMIRGMHSYPTPNTSTQKTEMDLHSGSKDLTVPSLMFMRFLQGTFSSSGKPPRSPPDSVLVGDISLIDALKSYPGGKGALGDTSTVLEGLRKHQKEGDLPLSSSLPSYIYNSALLEEEKGRYVLHTCTFCIRDVKEEISNMAGNLIDTSSTFSVLGSVDLYCRSQLLVD